MDVQVTDSIANAASLSARAGSGRAQPPFAARLQRFDDLANTVMDTSGARSDGERVQAYQTLQALSASGGLAGLDPARRKAFDQATYESDIGRRAQDLQRDYARSVSAAARTGGGADAALQAAVANVDSLSAADRDLLFQTSLNVPDRNGVAPFASVQAWRENSAAQARMVGVMKDAGVIGANGVLDQKAAQAKAAADPKFAAALQVSLRRDNTSPEWTQAVSQLFGADRAPDQVELSAEARSVMAQAPPARTAPVAQPAAYRQGSIVSITA